MANTEVFTRGPINKLLLETRGALLISLGHIVRYEIITTLLTKVLSSNTELNYWLSGKFYWWFTMNAELYTQRDRAPGPLQQRH